MPSFEIEPQSTFARSSTRDRREAMRRGPVTSLAQAVLARDPFRGTSWSQSGHGPVTSRPRIPSSFPTIRVVSGAGRRIPSTVHHCR